LIEKFYENLMVLILKTLLSKQNQCKARPVVRGANPKGYARVSNSDEKIIAAVREYGQVAVSIDAMGADFQNYRFEKLNLFLTKSFLIFII
jgi:hypothetical protein